MKPYSGWIPDANNENRLNWHLTCVDAVGGHVHANRRFNQFHFTITTREQANNPQQQEAHFWFTTQGWLSGG